MQTGLRVIWPVLHPPCANPLDFIWSANQPSNVTEEHHIANMDPSAFFTLHDYDNSAAWTAADIRRTYGLDDESAKDMAEDKKASVVKGVLDLYDKNGNGVIEKEEWMDGWVKDGKRLPDFGVSVTSSCCELEMESTT